VILAIASAKALWRNSTYQFAPFNKKEKGEDISPFNSSGNNAFFYYLLYLPDAENRQA
jgi:hypothetical protein